MSSSKIRYVFSDSPALQNGLGVPNHIGPLGSLYVDYNDGILYVNKDGISSWNEILDSTSVLTGGTTTFTGGTVSGPTYFTNGLSANTISATTYYNLPTDITLTGGTYGSGTTILNNNTGGTFNITGYTYIPHLEYNNSNATIWNNGYANISSNISFGENALVSCTTGTFNTAFGSSSLSANTTGSYNTGIGAGSLTYNTIGTQNFGIGSYALYYNTTGSYNTAIGVASLQNNTTAQRNVGIGTFTLYNNIGSRNIGIGFYAGSATKGSDNTLIGSDSNNTNAGLVSGSNNTIIGTLLSGVINGSNNTIFGKPTGLSSATTNNIIIADGSGNIIFKDDNVNTILPRLAGSGDRMVIASPNGELSARTITDTIFTGGTVNGPTIFTNGLTANTISATSINKVDYIVFNTGTTSATTVAGTVYFDNTEKALSYNTSINQGVTVNLGQQNYLRVFNNSGLDIPKGKGIELLSSYSGLPAIALAVNRHYNDKDVVGVSAEIIPNNSEGIVLTYGIISNITVTGASIGSLVYASDTTPGEFKNSTEFLNFPLTARTNAIGYIIQTGTTTGKLFVNPVNENNNLSLTDLQRNILEGNAISTGVFSFGGISLASSSTFNVGPAEGWIVDNTTNPLLTDVFYVKYSGQTNIPSLYYSSATQTYLLLTSAATLTQQITYPTPQQRRQSIYLGKMGHGNKTSLINVFSEPDFEISPISQIRDMFTPIKLINENIYPSPNTGLTFNTSSGILWGLGIGFATNQLNPSSITVSGNSPTTFQYRTQTGGTATNRTTIDPANYDLNGVITTIGSPAKQATNQRIFLLQNGQFRIQYGQTIYADLTTAIAAVTTESFTTFSNFKDNAILIAILSVRSDASLLSDTLQAKITFASKFGESVGGTGGVSTTNLQQAYNNSTNPEIVINSTLDGLSIENGTGNADNVTRLLEGLNSAGNVTSFIRADGDISGTTLQTNGFTANTNGISASTVNIRTIGSGTSITNLGVDSAGNVVSGSTGGNGTTFTGGTISGATIFTGGLSANTISATTYNNLPVSTSGTSGVLSSTNWTSFATKTFGAVFDGGGSVLTVGTTVDVMIPVAMTITSWTMLADVSGSAVVDLWKDTYANYPPTVADTITGSALPTITTAIKNTSSTLTGWTITVNANDIIRFNINSATTMTRLTISIQGTII